MEKEKTQISLTLAENESVIRTWCENCDDIQIRPMKLGKTGGTGALLIYCLLYTSPSPRDTR